MSTIEDRHFWRYIGAEPPDQMFREQLQETVAAGKARVKAWEEKTTIQDHIAEVPTGLVVQKKS